MPELPEVETVVRGLREPLIGRTIESVWWDWANSIRHPDHVGFADQVRGQTVRTVERRAKYILCQLDYDLLVVHLKMTGRLYVAPNEAHYDSDRWVHVCFQLDAGQQLRFSDSRKFGFVSLVNRLEDIAPNLGPEPLLPAFTVDVFRERLARHHRIIKALLLDQSFLAGVGNIYADEALHLAKIHPLRTADSLTDAEIALLHSTIRTVLMNAIEREGASISWYRKPDGTSGEAQNHFYVYNREGKPCFHCGGMIEKIRVAQRGTHYCPQCQRAVPARSSSAPLANKE